MTCAHIVVPMLFDVTSATERLGDTARASEDAIGTGAAATPLADGSAWHAAAGPTEPSALSLLEPLVAANTIVVAVVVTLVAVLFLASAIRIVKEYERGVIFRLGRLVGAKGPGLFFLIPILDKMVKVDLRTVTHDVPAQEIISHDNVPVKVNAVVYFRVVDPARAIVEVEHFGIATSQIAQTTLRAVIGRASLDELLAEREKLNKELQQIIDAATDPWGVKVGMVEIKDVELPQDMRRAMARQAEAERERRARVITAEGEFQAAQKLAEASDVMAASPGAMYLRTLQTLQDASDTKGTKVIFPLPLELLKALGFKD
jgi:regulator of protease activity HflC (stomatin/prohibitin superfamily)